MKIWNLPAVEYLPLNQLNEIQPVLLVTSAPAWQAVKSFLALPIAGIVEPFRAEEEHWQECLNSFRQLPGSLENPIIYAVGGGLPADAAKYLAARLEIPLTVVPTALTVDAFLTPASGIRKDGCVYYIETKVPERLVVDFDVIGAAPSDLRAAGITDVLSIATGCWDWRFAEERGQNPPGMEFVPYIHDAAQAILNGALDCAEAAGRGDRQGLKQLFDCLALEVQLCNQIGHARPEEGSEHYFAYAAENFTGPGLPHAVLVGPGILIAAGLQGQDVSRLRKALMAAGVPLDRISEPTQREVILSLPQFVRKHRLPYGIAHEVGKGEAENIHG